ncbi:ParB/Srx family N-terminal domain-containing protein [Paraburkholderia sp. SARCC-3016]|jgi:hypothetical protein|uniref:ParB/Srx family N-terminal domain-containing protein n=1 Tax=Paraburkholderia sp. SARCC-3016 TaxID=3058611 RepID=UPI002808E386|nr:ParB/Srx family N-terminal domain-containing protein [Paraburkholderia sp. SARCC-3016]MDQ7976018.1 ParB/Srx family N-terminal domain-containing protein [Paraburkholderia sp. SARCC-3016]
MPKALSPMKKPDNAMQWLPLASLKPTQITVGMQYVALKVLDTRRREGAARRALLERHPLPCVRAPDGSVYVVDHHHWARAWFECGIDTVPVRFALEVKAHSMPSFWRKMERRNWLHPFDAHGRRRDVSELPGSIAMMRDDPYQSLAALARQCGAYRKSRERYSSFVWADFLREHVRLPGNDKVSLLAALVMCAKVARSRKARRLPGYAGAMRA